MKEGPSLACLFGTIIQEKPAVGKTPSTRAKKAAKQPEQLTFSLEADTINVQ